MAKTKFVCIATSGATIDGRNIEPAQLTQAAKNYNPKTYAARCNIEHIRGVSGDKPFGMYGDVLALKTEDIELDIAGKKEKRTALYAELEVSDDLLALNKSGQKLYSSIEIISNFAGSNEAYLVGSAFTDSPASLGTERLQFSAKSLGNLVSTATEVALEAAPEAAATSEAESFMSGLKNFITGLSTKPAETAAAPVIVPAVAAGAPDLSAFTLMVQEGFNKFAAAMEASNKAQTAGLEKLTSDLATFKAEVEKAPASTYTQRPLTSGGGNQDHLADF